MAASDGPTSQPVEETSEHLAFLHAAAPNAKSYEVFALLRAVEARARGLPRIGQSRLPGQNIVDLTQAPILAFPASTLESITVSGGRSEVRGYYLGLTGPMGPLPLHMTEFAFFERRYARSRPFGRFLDLLAGRMLQFFYRAWADSQPVVHADRPEDDRFAGYLAALSGAGEGVGKSSAFPMRARLFYAGLFAGRRSALAIQDALTSLLQTPVKLHDFQSKWRDIEPGDRTRLGRSGGYNALGRDTVLGSRVRGVSDAFRVTVRTTSFKEYESFLPSGRKFKIAAEALQAFAPSHLQWELELEIEGKQARTVRLDGRSRLGQTSWVNPGKGLRADARLGSGAH
jgi:type VI secretion system ImpH/TssG family protein